jgi:hypothetical protein
MFWHYIRLAEIYGLMTEVRGFEHQWVRINASSRQTREGPSISIEVFARTPRNRWVECLRFDCFADQSHFHVFSRQRGDREQVFGEGLTLSAAVGEALHMLEIEGVDLVASAGYDASAGTCTNSEWSRFIKGLAMKILGLNMSCAESA